MRLKQYVFPGLVALALCAAVLVAWPAPAQAQASSSSAQSARGGADASPTRVVVHSGDCLWSISQRLLPANATPQQIYYEVARIYALNRDRIGEDPNLIYAGEVLLVEPAPKSVADPTPKPVADPAGSGQTSRGAGSDIEAVLVDSTPRVVAEPAGSGQTSRVAGPDLSERSPAEEGAPKKAAAAESSRETAQRSSPDVSRAAAREPYGTPPTDQSLPKLDHAPILKSVAKLSPKTASDEERWLPEGQLLVAAVVGTVISWGAVCLILAVGFFVARKLPTKRTPAEHMRNGGHQRRPEAAPPAPDPSPSTLVRPAQKLPQPLRTPPPKPQIRTTKGGRS
jgi:hypothetical protein